jgi:hypothetical protein
MTIVRGFAAAIQLRQQAGRCRRVFPEILSIRLPDIDALCSDPEGSRPQPRCSAP